MLIETFSGVMSQALQQGNSQSTAWASLDTIGVPPSGDGVIAAGHGGLYAPNRLKLIPYCEGGVGGNFSVRLYGWEAAGLTDVGLNYVVLIPRLLAELACTSCNRPGPPSAGPGPSARYLKDSEYLCDTITLTQGALGLTGSIASTGPGTDLVASALVELGGCRFVQFDFQQTDPVGMNCFWARA